MMLNNDFDYCEADEGCERKTDSDSSKTEEADDRIKEKTEASTSLQLTKDQARKVLLGDKWFTGTSKI